MIYSLDLKAQQCLIIGLENYGDIALDELKKISPPEEYDAYKKIYEEQKIQIRQAREGK